MKTSYSENYSPHKLLLRVAVIVFETVHCYSNMSSGSHTQQLLIVSLGLCICRTLRIILLYNIIHAGVLHGGLLYMYAACYCAGVYKALCIWLSANKTSNFLWYCQLNLILYTYNPQSQCCYIHVVPASYTNETSNYTPIKN